MSALRQEKAKFKLVILELTTGAEVDALAHAIMEAIDQDLDTDNLDILKELRGLLDSVDYSGYDPKLK